MTGRDGGRIAFAFPGVGVRPCGREASFFSEHRADMAPLFDAASEAAGADLARHLLDPNAELLHDRAQQYLTYAFGAGAARAFARMGFSPSCTAGYSFGVWTALFAAGALSFEDGMAAFSRAYELMARASEGLGWSMGVVVGLEEGDVRRLIEARGGSLVLVNSNNDTCHVLSGRSEDLDPFLEEALREDAFGAQRLPVDIPYHHRAVLAGASAALRAFLDGLSWRAPICPVISSIDRRVLSRPDELAAFAADNLSTPICWRDVVGALDEEGFAAIVECGPGVSLTQNARFTATGLRWVNLKNARREALAHG